LEHFSIQFHILTITLPEHIYQIPHNTQDVSTKEANQLQDPQLTLFNLPRQFFLLLAQVLSLWTTNLIGKMLPVMIFSLAQVAI